MTDRPIELAQERRKRSDDACDWTAHDCLEQLLEDMAAGRSDPGQLIVLLRDKGTDPDSGLVAIYAAGVSLTEGLALIKLGELAWMRQDD